jgi:DNA-binding transcriptional ArsR family regulator
MPKRSGELDLVFQALADPTRRAVLERLSDGPRATSELARPFPMALPSFMQHLDVLQKSGLIRSRKLGRVRAYEVSAERLQAAEHWLVRQRALWNRRLNQLDAYLEKLKENE